MVVDIDTGAFEVAADDLSASRQMLAKHPGAVLYGLRVGQRAAYRIGAMAMLWGTRIVIEAQDNGSVEIEML